MGDVRTLNGGTGPTSGPFVISITSGKGGVGKTLTTVNSAVAARRLGMRVLILDGDLGLANVDVVLGLSARSNLRDVLDGHCTMTDIMVEGPMGIKVVPSGSGIASLTRLTTAQKQLVLEQLQCRDGLGSDFDLILIDTGAGINDTVLAFNSAADKICTVTTPEPHSLTDAYALIKVMAEEYGRRSFHLVVNQTRSAGEGLKVFERIAEVAKRFLDVHVEFLGSVPFDPQVSKSVMQRRAASEQSTYTVAGQAWNKIAREILDVQGTQGKGKGKEEGNAQQFWRNLLWAEPHQKSSM